jgi:tRNA nucleotidyltransferase/poly(A) polymerase
MSTGQARADDASFAPPPLPDAVRHVLGTLIAAGHEAALVGGCLRDLLRGEVPVDWDVATSAPPEAGVELFPDSAWENRFGTVTVRGEGPNPAVEVTTYRIEGPYADRRRPDEVRWGTSLTDDLSRRDFTINAIGWVPVDLNAGSGRLVDPFGGQGDLATGVIRAVGDPDKRIAEDALRLVRAVRFAARFEMEIDKATAAAIQRHAGLAAGLSGERVRDELLRILLASPAAQPPSVAFRLMEELGLLAVLLPELAALRGVPQAKALPGDALEHSLRTMDALSPNDPFLRLVGLLHDVGKASTLAGGHFYGHETVGGQMVEAILRRLAFPHRQIERGARLVRHHMFAYSPEWTDAAVRRFIRRAGPAILPDLFALRAADNIASGAQEPYPGGVPELQARVGLELASNPLTTRQLAVRGDDLVAALDVPPGPLIGELLRRLLEAVLDDPSLNSRAKLLELARRWHSEASVVEASSGDGDGVQQGDIGQA